MVPDICPTNTGSQKTFKMFRKVTFANWEDPKADLLTKWLTPCPTSWLTSWLSPCLTKWLTSWLSPWLISWPKAWLPQWPAPWLTSLFFFLQLISFGNKNKAGEFYLYPISNSVLIEFHLKWKTYFQDEGGRQAEISHKLREWRKQAELFEKLDEEMIYRV